MSILSNPTPDANKSKVKLLGGVQVLFNVIRTVPKKEKEVKLRLAATTTMLSLCDENGKCLW